MYNAFGITWDTDINEIANEDFPIFTDLHELITKKVKEEEKKGNTVKANDYEELALLLQDIALGSDVFLWNGHSTKKRLHDVYV